jgi:hypothetical protein
MVYRWAGVADTEADAELLLDLNIATRRASDRIRDRCDPGKRPFSVPGSPVVEDEGWQPRRPSPDKRTPVDPQFFVILGR